MATKRRKRRHGPGISGTAPDAAQLRQMADELEHDDRLVRAMGLQEPTVRRGRVLRGRQSPGYVAVAWQWPGARVAKTFREELAGARLVRRTMGRPPCGRDVTTRRARTAAERATGEWVPGFRWSFAAKDRAELDELERRARKLTGVTVWVIWRPGKPGKRLLEYQL